MHGGFHRYAPSRPGRTLSRSMRATADAPTRPGALTEARPAARLSHGGVWVVAAGALLAVVFLALRYRLALTPTLAETYYDEALTGLMALAILHGTPQVFYWGEPYGGAIGDAYPAALGFWLFGPSTLVLRMASAVIAVLWAWSVWFIARRAGAGPFAFLAGLLVAVPPVFLSHAQLSTHGESSALAFGTLAWPAPRTWSMRARLRRAPRPGRSSAWRPASAGGRARSPPCCCSPASSSSSRGRGSSAAPGPTRPSGSSSSRAGPSGCGMPHHDWATFRHLATWGGPLPPWSIRFQIVGETLLESLRDYFWDGRAVRLPSWARVLSWITVLGVYVPGLFVAVGRAVVWTQRIRRRERPWRDALDLVVGRVLGTVAAHLLTWFGTSTVLRYAMTFQATLPVLCAMALARLAAVGGTPVAGLLAAALLGFNLVTHVAFVRDGEARPGAPSTPPSHGSRRSESIPATRTDGSRRSSRSSRASECSAPTTSGSGTMTFLRAVDRVDDPSAVAIVTHRALRRPHPDVMAQALELAGARYKREDVGDYAIFHGFVAPGPVKPIVPAGWVARASARTEAAALALDRRVWTRWAAPQRPGQWFEVDLGRPYPVAQLTLVAAPWPSEAPEGLRVETSVDGSTWRTVASVREVLPGLHWWKGHPRVDDSGRRHRPDGATAHSLRAPHRDREGGARRAVEHRRAVRLRGGRDAVGAPARGRRGRDRRRAPAGPLDGRPRGAQSDPRPRHVRAPAGAGPLEPRCSPRRTAPSRSRPSGKARTTSTVWPSRGRAGRTRSISTSSGPRRTRHGRRSSAGPRQADTLPEGLWRRGRMERWAEALDRLGRSDAAAAIRLRLSPGTRPPHQDPIRRRPRSGRRGPPSRSPAG